METKMKYILHINDSGYSKDRKALNGLGNKIPLVTGKHYKDFDIDVERLTDEQKVAYEEIKKEMHETFKHVDNSLPIGVSMDSLKTGWKLEVVHNGHFDK